jgi:hypothetical protein
MRLCRFVDKAPNPLFLLKSVGELYVRVGKNKFVA